MTEQESKQILERLLSTKDVLVGNEHTAVSVAISALNTVIAAKAKEAHKITTIPEEKLLRRLEEIEGEFANWHISAHKSDLLYEEKADIEKELARRKTLKETSLKHSKTSTPPSEPSYELVYTSYGDIGLAIDVTEDNTPIRVLTRYDSHNYDPKLEAGFSEYGGANLVHWIHTNVYLTTKDWKHISYKKSSESILQELNINTEETYSPNLSK